MIHTRFSKVRRQRILISHIIRQQQNEFLKRSPNITTHMTIYISELLHDIRRWITRVRERPLSLRDVRVMLLERLWQVEEVSTTSWLLSSLLITLSRASWISQLLLLLGFCRWIGCLLLNGLVRSCSKEAWSAWHGRVCHVRRYRKRSQPCFLSSRSVRRRTTTSLLHPSCALRLTFIKSI